MCHQTCELLHETAQNPNEPSAQQVAVLDQGFQGQLNWVALLFKEVGVGLDANGEIAEIGRISGVIGPELSPRRRT